MINIQMNRAKIRGEMFCQDNVSIYAVGYPQADVIRETSAADDMPPLAPPELPRIGDPTANISPRKNASYMRYRCEASLFLNLWREEFQPRYTCAVHEVHM